MPEKLPKGWVKTTLGEVCLPVKNVRPEDSPYSEFTYFDIGGIDNETNRIVEPKSFRGDTARRKETALFRRFTHAEIVARDKANFDIQWQQETTSTTQRETPQALMKQILKDLEEAMKEFSAAESEIRQ
jgi:hypothetical protein